MNNSANQLNTQRKTSNQNIQVYVRVRPLNARERCLRSTEVIDVLSPREILTRHSIESKVTKKFTFDRTFGTDSRQVDVYNTVVAPLIDEVLAGYNCTVFAYGQTGTGKTHTMVGNETVELKSSWEDDSDIGIIPRALSHLFDELRMLEMEFSMRISYLELYNEELCDLLSSDDTTKIRIFDDSTKKGSVIIQGLEEITVQSKDDVYKLLEKGKERRRTATTLMNAQSSRSHTVFSILVHIRENGLDGDEMLKIGKLNLVDLAGSENVTKAGNEKGIRARETVNINQSLLTLGRVITALVERTPHIPYRESKLTRLLQESLGGRTKTSIIATISPGHKDIDETLSTLEYAYRAKNIQNKPELNQKLVKKTVLKEYTEEIDKLKRELLATRERNGIYLPEETFLEMTLKMESQNRELNEKVFLLKALKDELASKDKVFNEISLHLLEKSETIKQMNSKITDTENSLMHTKKVLTKTKRSYTEKKVLLESHIKTEAELMQQATQILEVADIATADTDKLHNTIERRKHIDQKILSTCEVFVERMRNNFKRMNVDSSQFHSKYAATYKSLMEELDGTTSAHDAMLRETNDKIEKVNMLYEQSLMKTSAIGEKYLQMVDKTSVEYRDEILVFFKEVFDNSLEKKAEIQDLLKDVVHVNNAQRESLEVLCTLIKNAMLRSDADLKSYTTRMQELTASAMQTAHLTVQKLDGMSAEMERERLLVAEEQGLIDEFVVQMELVKKRRINGAIALTQLNAELQTDNTKIVKQLQDCSNTVQEFSKTCNAANSEVVANIFDESNRELQLYNRNVVSCEAMKSQFEELFEYLGNEVASTVEKETKRYKLMQTEASEFQEAAKLINQQTKDQCSEMCASLQTDVKANVQQLKQRSMAAAGNAKALQNAVLDFVGLQQERIEHSYNDVEKYKHHELQTYAPTGSTPARREFIYPRALASTLPHSSIVKRVCLENEWSDMDTTSTIDEDSESEINHIIVDDLEVQSIQEVSDTETVFNSTPMNDSDTSTEKRISGGRNSSNSGGRNSSNTLKPPQQSMQERQGSEITIQMLRQSTPPKASATMEDKENSAMINNNYH